MATLPPPMTATFSPIAGLREEFVRRRKSMPAITPLSFSPGTPMGVLFQAPMAM